MTEPKDHRSPEAWNVTSLHHHFCRLLDEHAKRVEERFRSQEQTMKAALANAEKALDKAETATAHRFDSVNEFRQALADQTGAFISRQEYEAKHQVLLDMAAEVRARTETSMSKLEYESKHEALTIKLDACTSRLDKLEARSGGLNAGWGYLIGFIGVAAAIISTVAAIVKH